MRKWDSASAFCSHSITQRDDSKMRARRSSEEPSRAGFAIQPCTSCLSPAPRSSSVATAHRITSALAEPSHLTHVAHRRIRGVGEGGNSKCFSPFLRLAINPPTKTKHHQNIHRDGINFSVFQLKRKGKNTELGEGGLPRKKQSHHQASTRRVDDIIAQNLMIIITHGPISSLQLQRHRDCISLHMQTKKALTTNKPSPAQTALPTETMQQRSRWLNRPSTPSRCCTSHSNIADATLLVAIEDCTRKREVR